MSNTRFIINVNDKFISIVDLSQHLMKVSSEEITKFLKNKGVKVPSTVLRRVYKEVLDERGALTHINRVCSKEFNKLMEDYDNLTIFQYASLVETANLVIDGRLIKHKFFMVLFEDIESYKIGDDDIINLLRKSVDPQFQKDDSAMDFYVNIRRVMHDEEEHLDGLHVDKASYALAKVSTVSDINEFGKILGTDIPAQITKDMYIDRLFNILKEKKLYTLKLAQTLTGIDYRKLEMFSIDNNFKVVSEVEKKIMVDYVFEYIQKRQREIDAENIAGVVVTTSPLELLKSVDLDIPVKQLQDAEIKGLDFGSIAQDIEPSNDRILESTNSRKGAIETKQEEEIEEEIEEDFIIDTEDEIVREHVIQEHVSSSSSYYDSGKQAASNNDEDDDFDSGLDDFSISFDDDSDDGDIFADFDDSSDNSSDDLDLDFDF